MVSEWGYWIRKQWGLGINYEYSKQILITADQNLEAETGCRWRKLFYGINKSFKLKLSWNVPFLEQSYSSQWLCGI